MIREYRETDIDQILEIWLTASISAHNFVEPSFWESRVNDMRSIYIPAAQNMVFESKGEIAGFYSLVDNTLAAIFVRPDLQGNGIGAALLDDAKRRREHLRLSVYRENHASVSFYEKHGFVSIDELIDEHTGHAEIVMAYHASPRAPTSAP